MAIYFLCITVQSHFLNKQNAVLRVGVTNKCKRNIYKFSIPDLSHSNIYFLKCFSSDVLDDVDYYYDHHKDDGDGK